jgi:ABC-type antimicrobial peptide transport system permease subunit
MVEKILYFLEEGFYFVIYIFLIFLLLKVFSAFGKYRMKKLNIKQLRRTSQDLGFIRSFISSVLKIFSYLILFAVLIGVFYRIFFE